HLHEGRLRYVHNYLGLTRFSLSADEPVPAGDVVLGMEFDPTGSVDFGHGRGVPGVVTLLVDGEVAARAELPYTVPNHFGMAGLSCGYAAFDSVDPDAYAAPAMFTGTIHRVVLDVSGELQTHPGAEMTRMMVQQ